MATKFLDYTGLSHLWSKFKEWCNSIFVTKATNENITGIKTFSNDHSWRSDTNDHLSSIQLQSPVLDRTVDPENSTYMGLEFLDKNSSVDLDYTSRLGGVELGKYAESLDLEAAKCAVYLKLYNPTTTTRSAATFGLDYDQGDRFFAYAPSTSDSRTSGTDILTRDWIPKDTRIVHTSGDEVIEGYKTFYAIRTKSYTIEKGITPSSNRYLGIDFADKNGNSLGGIQFAQRSAGGYDLKLGCYNQSTDNLNCIYCGTDANGIDFAQATSTSTSRNSGIDIVTRDWIPKDTRIIHTTGDEHIGGNKYFDNGTYFANGIASIRWARTDVSFTASGYTVPSSSVYNGIALYDTTGNAVGYDYFRIQPSGNFAKVWSLCNSDNTASTHFVYGYNKSSDSFYLDGPADFSSSENSTKIPNTAWVWSSAVMLSGNQTVAGVKTFTDYIRFKSSSPDIVFINTGLVKGTNPSGYMWNELLFCDGSEDSSDTHRIGGMHAYVNGNGQTSMQFRVHNWEAGSTDFAILGIYYPKNGTPYTTAPTPPTNDDSTKIATTEWVNSQGFVDTTNTQTINGSKTFTSTIEVKRNNPYLYLTETDWEKGTPQGPNSNSYQGIQFREKNSTFAGCVYYNYMSSKASGIHLSVANMTSASATGEADVWLFWNTDNSKAFRPGTNGDILLGWSNYRWKEVWCTQSSINSTSDERIKDEINIIPDNILDAWDDVNWIQFKYKDALQEKGNNARLHNGLIAQEIDRVFKSKNLDISKYGLFLYDSWEEVSEEKDKDGNIIQHYMPAGDSYGLRYVEALCMEAAYQRRKNKILENRISELEKRLIKLEGIIQ